MKSAWIVAVLVCVVLAGTAWAQVPYLPVGFGVRNLGMGMTGTAVADDSGAWYQNPAGLVDLSVMAPEGKDWAHDAQASYISIGGIESSPFESFDTVRLNWSTCNREDRVGVGAGYTHIDLPSAFGVAVVGAGAGIGIGNTGFSLGADVVNINPSAPFSIPDETLLGLGAMYRINQSGKRPIRIGLTYTNVTEENYAGGFPIPSTLNVGVNWPITDNITVAADILDILEDVQDTFGSGAPGLHWNVGGEFAFGSNRQFAVRGGLFDLDISGVDMFWTLGAGFRFGRFRVDGAWVSPIEGSLLPPGLSFNSTWSVGAGMEF